MDKVDSDFLYKDYVRKINCKKGCCMLQHIPYTSKRYITGTKFRLKAGIFLFDPLLNKILMVQSRGNLWGLPKGTKKQNETDKECAIREVKEETGLMIELRDDIEIRIKNKAIYYYKFIKECPVNIQTDIKNNDANGVGWIKVSCLCDLIRDGIILVNQHCKIILKTIFGIELPVRDI